MALTASALSGCTSGSEPVAAPPEVGAPAVSEGEALGWWTGTGGGAVTASVDAQGAGLLVALDCVGGGTVRVEFSPGSSSTVACPADELASELNRIEIAHPEPMKLTVTPSDGASWGLTVSRIDLAPPAEG